MQDFVPPLVYFTAGHFYPAALWPRGANTWSHSSLPAHIGWVHCVRVGQVLDYMLPSLLREVLGGAPTTFNPRFAEKDILAAFAAAEQVPFPDAKLRELMPSVHAHCCLVSQALSVPLSWVLLAETCTAAFLAPTGPPNLFRFFLCHGP